ncbi:hypothetical protein HMSSN036_09530 [Paenibacillus macerans]|nr:hypothetical protein HMSSN036_09530 [Paenibacillus macerans]
MTIRLTVVNQFGLSSTTEKTINITNELLYPEDEFNKIFVPVGDKFTFDGGQVPSWNKIQYSYTSEPVTLIRSNSPETVYSKGLLYRENAIGATRFMVHHVNSTGTPKNMYVIATNNNAETTHLSQSFLGFGGPSPFATAAGKVSVQRYFESMQNGNKYKDMWLAPGESKIILNELSEKPLKQGDVISLFADLNSDHMLQYNVVMVDQGEDPISALPNLIAPPEDVHNRGTYMGINPDHRGYGFDRDDAIPPGDRRQRKRPVPGRGGRELRKPIKRMPAILECCIKLNCTVLPQIRL